MKMAIAETAKVPTRSILRRLFPVRIKYIESGAAVESLYSFLILYTEDEIKSMPSSQRLRLMEALASKLKKSTISEAYVPDFILNLPESDIVKKAVYIPSGVSIMRALSARSVISYIKKRSLSPQNTHICIYSPKFGEEEEAICRRLLSLTKDICLASEDTKSAALTADSIYDTSGLSCTVSSAPPSQGRYNIFILLGDCKTSLPEKAYIFDAARRYKSSCKNNLNFVFPFNMSGLATHFDEKNQSCAEFILSCCGMKERILKNAEDALSFIGCEIKSITYKRLDI